MKRRRLSARGFNLVPNPRTESECIEWARYLLADLFYREYGMTAAKARAAARRSRAKPTTAVKDGA